MHTLCTVCTCMYIAMCIVHVYSGHNNISTIKGNQLYCSIAIVYMHNNK